MPKICPVKKAALEIHGGWDLWEDDSKGIVKVDGVDYVCQNAAFLYTVRKMEFARHKLGGSIPSGFFRKVVGKSRNQVYSELCLIVLADVRGRLDMALNAADRIIYGLHMAVIGMAYRKQSPPVLPLFEPEYKGEPEEVVNQYVDYANMVLEKTGGDMSKKIKQCAMPKADNKPDSQFIEPRDMPGFEQVLEMELDIIRGIGFREAELVAAAQKLVEVEVAIGEAVGRLAARR